MLSVHPDLKMVRGGPAPRGRGTGMFRAVEMRKVGKALARVLVLARMVEVRVLVLARMVEVVRGLVARMVGKVRGLVARMVGKVRGGGAMKGGPLANWSTCPFSA